MKQLTDDHGARRYEMDRAETGLARAHEATSRLRQLIRPGLPDAVASMLLSDIESAMARLLWLRDRLREDEGGQVA